VKVLVDALQAANRSGTGVYVAQLATHLWKVAPDLDVGFAWPKNLPPPTGVPGDRFVPVSSGNPATRALYELGGFEQLARRVGAALVHYPATVRVLRCRIPHVVTVHDLAFLHNPAWFRADRALFYRMGACRAVKDAAEIIAVSDATARDLGRCVKCDPDRVTVVHNGGARVGDDPSLPSADEVRERFGLPASFFLFLGTLEPRKNLVRLVEAWSSIAERTPLDLVIAGRRGWKGGALAEALRRAPARERIHLPGFIPDACLPGLHRAASVFVYPSLWEGFGIPVLEAMARGVPVITSNVSSMPEIAGDAAILVDPEETDSLAGAMTLLATDPDLCAVLSERGLARAEQFSWEACAQGTAEVYRRALRKAGNA
jgi:glycosyltransferase involved in cell wall biosynthesis